LRQPRQLARIDRLGGGFFRHVPCPLLRRFVSVDLGAPLGEK
jgi:hypothetical protein